MYPFLYSGNISEQLFKTEALLLNSKPILSPQVPLLWLCKATLFHNWEGLVRAIGRGVVATDAPSWWWLPKMPTKCPFVVRAVHHYCKGVGLGLTEYIALWGISYREEEQSPGRRKLSF